MQCVLCGMSMNTYIDRFGNEYQKCPGCNCETQHYIAQENITPEAIDLDQPKDNLLNINR